MTWQKISEAIPRDAKTISRGAQVDGAQVCKLWHEYAAQYFGPIAMAAHEALNFRDGVLTISVADATYLLDIRRQQPKIIRLINQALGGNLVKTVRYLA